MQFASADLRSRLVARTRAAMPASVLWSLLLVFLLTLSLARSTVTAAWVPGIDVVVLIALAAVVVMGVLAISPLPAGAGVAIGLALGPAVALYVTGSALRDSFPQAQSSNLLSDWLSRVLDGSAFDAQAFDLFLICCLMWVTGGWLSWCVLRWRQPMLGLVPGAAAFATNVLNFPIDQNGYVLTILVLTLALLLWSNYSNSVSNADRARVRLTGDARWDFWESGLVAMAALIVLAIMLPPLSTVDRTTEMESSAFSSWAQFMQALSHPTIIGKGPGAGTTGFTDDVKLGGALKKSHAIVFTYTITGTYEGPRYFRGLNLEPSAGGVWSYPVVVRFKDRIAQNTSPDYAEDYTKLALATFNVRMVSPPVGFDDILFYPSQLDRTNRNTVATEITLPLNADGSSLATIDRLSSLNPPTSAGSYAATVDYSVATAADLSAAGTAYPEWVVPYTSLPPYRSPAVLKKIRLLAQDIVDQAGARTPYAMASAIEAYLRDLTRFTYTLAPPTTPDGVDPLDFFLFTSKKGYCEFFATAMADMLRSLGIPTRLVNGFGPGSYESSLNSYVVRGEDAHTWVESYFPAYGWIPFEPTPDNVYFPIPRGSTGTGVCLRDAQCTNPGGSTPGAGATPTGNRGGPGGLQGEQQGPGTGPGGLNLRLPDAGTLTTALGIFLAVILLVFAAVARYLRPRSVMGVWKRTLVLSRMAGAESRPSETPFETSRRVRSSFPEVTEPMRTLARGFVVAAYAAEEEAKSTRRSVMEAWNELRPLLLRRILSRLRPREL